MSTGEIVLPETKPETEWVRGRALQKVSPQRDHSRLQGILTIELTRWAAGRGEVGREWRFLVIVVDPQRRIVELHDRAQTVSLDENGAIEHWALPEFSYSVRELFQVLKRTYNP
jgi:Uma2 family endonuclease